MGLLLVAEKDNIVTRCCYVALYHGGFVVLHLLSPECMIEWVIEYGYELDSWEIKDTQSGMAR